MNRTDAPKKQPVPFGTNGPRQDLLTTTPAGSNRASYDAGYPQVTMILKSAGGIPPEGQDMNQILYELSALCRWNSSGAINSFDSEFASGIAGYPKGSLLLGSDGSTIYISTIDANTNDPNSSSSGWEELTFHLGINTIKKYGAPLIGELIEWPLQQMPHEVWTDCGMEFIPYMGQSFDGTKYPLLSQLHPTNVLPADMRAYVARGWDNGRGVDTGRVLMSSQGDAIRPITGAITSADAYALFWTGTKTASGVFGTTSSSKTYANSTTGSGSAISELSIDVSKTVPTAAENRVKTVAWNFIVRAK